MAHTELDLRERRAIEDMLNAKMPVSKIAAEIGRHRSTVYREIKRNYFTDEELPYLSGYYGMNAQRYASDRRARRRKLIRLEDLRSHVIEPPLVCRRPRSKDTGSWERRSTEHVIQTNCARAVRMVLDHEAEYASRSAAILSISQKVGCSRDSLRIH